MLLSHLHMLQDCFQVFQLTFSICPLHATCLTHCIIHTFIIVIIDGVKILKLWRCFAASFTLCFNLFPCEIWSSYSGAPEDESLLWCELCHWANRSRFFLYCLTLTIKALWLCKMSETNHPVMQHHIQKILISFLPKYHM